MSYKRLVLTVVAVAVLVLACVLCCKASGKARVQPSANVPHWEYLVVPGNAEFSSQNVLNKKIGNPYPFAQQAAILQVGMDDLGKQGWELVSVVGTIGGDQEFIFTRRR